YELRFDFAIDDKLADNGVLVHGQRLFVLMWLVPLQLLLLARFHQLTSLLGYFSTPDLARMFHSLAFGFILCGGVRWICGAEYAPPRGVLILDFVFALVGLTGVRLFLRVSREMAATGKELEQKKTHRHRVAIIGAGDAGALLVHELSLKPGLGLDPVAFFD